MVMALECPKGDVNENFEIFIDISGGNDRFVRF
jgi:hypothetical protein